MAKNKKVTLLDPPMIQKMIYDEDQDAMRVVIVSEAVKDHSLPEVKTQSYTDYTSFLKNIKIWLVAQVLISSIIMLLLITRR